MSALIFKPIHFDRLTLLLCFVYKYSKIQDGRNIGKKIILEINSKIWKKIITF